MTDRPQAVLGSIAPLYFVEEMTRQHREKQREARQIAACLSNLPNPSGQYLTAPKPTRTGVIGDWVRRGMESPWGGQICDE
jgi:hypothetical protein